MNTNDRVTWKEHLKKYGTNYVPNRYRLNLKWNKTPAFYMFLLIVVFGQYCADYLYYDYLQWYIQGTAMLVIWLITVAIFKCGRMRSTRREEMLAEEREQRLAEARSTMIRVTRDGHTTQIAANELTVGDKFDMRTGEKIPCDCIVS